MPEKKLRLIVGLGNPGQEYENTRHNVGFLVIDRLAKLFSISVEKEKYSALYGRGLINDIEAILLKPMLFMNRSGEPVFKYAKYFKISSEDMLVIHDDIDLAFGIIKIKEKGGHGGHKGIMSLIDAFGTGEFIRLRIGIGRPKAEIDVTNHVLGRFNKNETKIMDVILNCARDAAVTVLCKGTKEGMNLFNNKNMVVSS